MMSVLHKRKVAQESQTAENKRLGAEKRAEAVRAIRSIDKSESKVKEEFCTMKNDDFFDEYNMRMYRKKVPSIGERGVKIESDILCPV